MEKQNTSSFDRISHWVKSSISLKMMTIAFMVLVLMIPLGMVQQTINERSWRKEAVVSEISQSWSGAQTIKGPILSVPYTTKHVLVDADGKSKTEYIDHYLQILPEQLNIQGPISTQPLKRGIYQVNVYDTDLKIKGHFNIPEFQINNFHKMAWDQAFLTMGISDMKGVQDEIRIAANDTSLNISSGTKINGLIPAGITADMALTDESEFIPFAIDLSIKGSGHIQFLPLGKTTDVQLTSAWPDPSFMGEYLPSEREVTDEGFNASWKVLHLNRNYPQHWSDNDYSNEALINTAFGVQLFPNTDDYQVVTRASKYGLMTIALTFLAFFLVEVMNKVKIHPMQYILVGLGLVVFYILLVSITEHGGFNMAYLVGAGAIILMIFLYAMAIFKDRRLAFGLLAVLLAVYAFVFVTLQLVDYALLIGSIGLTIILALTMYLTRNIDWFNVGGGLKMAKN